MRMISLLVLGLSLLVLMTSCGSESDAARATQAQPKSPDDAPPTVPPAAAAALGHVVFESYFINFAWGFQLNGRFIDGDGVIWEYSRNDAEQWMPRTTIDGRLLASSLDLKVQDASQVGFVDPAMLAKMAALLEPASKTELTRVQAGADMGADNLVGYRFDPETDTLEEVMLRSRGDWNIDNPSPAATELIEWLEQVMPAREDG